MKEDLQKIYTALPDLTAKDKELIEKAYKFAGEKHEGQRRNSGEPYFSHLLATAQNLADLHMDTASIVAGFLHDTLEDTDTKKEELEKEFGKDVLFIVEGVTKISHMRYHGTDRHNESLRRLLLATSEDIRVLVVKLSDRLHNMRTLSHVNKEKQRRIAAETLEIYAPIAYRLGIRKLSRELEDLAFPYVYPEGYKELTSLLKQGEEERKERLEQFRKSVSKELVKAGLTEFKSDYRVKGLYSLYKKYIAFKKDFEKIYDVLAMRITVKKTEDCYRVLGIIHSAWKPLPGRIKDYIAFPKINGYQSLHTTVFTGDGGLVEIQIRTEEMHREAEYGVASHALYKSESSIQSQKEVADWIRSISEQNVADIKRDFLSERIFVYTPKGDVIDLPKGASAIDFAYMIHSDIGNHMSGAKINGKLCSLTSILKGGEIVEVITSKNAKPNRKWLDFVKTTFARKHIKNFTT